MSLGNIYCIKKDDFTSLLIAPLNGRLWEQLKTADRLLQASLNLNFLTDNSIRKVASQLCKINTIIGSIMCGLVLHFQH